MSWRKMQILYLLLEASTLLMLGYKHVMGSFFLCVLFLILPQQGSDLAPLKHLHAFSRLVLAPRRLIIGPLPCFPCSSPAYVITLVALTVPARAHLRSIDSWASWVRPSTDIASK